MTGSTLWLQRNQAKKIKLQRDLKLKVTKVNVTKLHEKINFYF